MARKIDRFGELLSEGIVSVAKRKGKRIAQIERVLAGELKFTHHTIQRWRRGFVPEELEQIAFLARYCVQNGRLNRTWANSFLTHADYPPREREALLVELFPSRSASTEPPYLHQNLPPRYGEFLGRQADMTRVIEGLLSRWPLISIEGMAGVGKTTLALEAARRCLAEGETLLDKPFQAVVWVSAKDQPEQKHWLDEVLDTIARVLNYPYITQLEPEQKKNEVNRLLQGYRVLLIIDNFETIEDSDLERWLLHLPEPSKAILTARHRQMERLWDVHLEGLDKEEALMLIRHHIRRLGELQDLDKAANDKLLHLADVTGGNPKAIEMALGYIKRGMLSFDEVVDNLYQARETVNDVFDYLFTHAWELLDENVRHLLMAAAFFTESAGKEALGHVAGLQIYQLHIAFGQLNDLSFLSVDTASSRYSIHPLTRAFAGSKLQMAPEWQQAGRERWLEWGRGLAEQALNSTNYGDLKPEMPNLIGILDWLLAQSRIADLAWFFQHTQRLLFAEGYWLPYLRFTDEILKWADSADDRELFRKTLHNLINIVRRHNTRETAQKWVELAQAFADRTGDELLQAEVWLAQGRLWYEKGLDRADIMKKALEIFRRYNEVEKVAQTLNHLGNIHVRIKEFEKAVPYYQEALEALQTPASAFSIHEQREWRAIINGNLGIVLGRQGQYAEACRILDEIMPGLVDKSDYAEVYVLLAYYELQQGHEEKAYRLRRQADELIESLGIVDPVCEEDQAWRELHGGAI